jgi:ABC-2 type transport system permease protein/lipopolysaccharide transport system permease protein
MNKAIADLLNGLKLYKVWLHQAYHVLSVKYKRTVLGSLWIAANFTGTSIAISIVFGALFHQNLRETLPYTMMGFLMAGNVLWIVAEAPELYIVNSSIIKNHAYPFTYFSFEAVAKTLFLFAHNLVVFYIFNLIMGTTKIPLWPIIPGLMLNIICMLTWGSVVGMMAARYRDLRFLLPNISTLMFFLTPVYWRPDTLGNKRWIADFNPMYHMIAIVREPFLGNYPSAGNWEVVTCIALLGLCVWFAIFSVFRRRIPFWI